MRLYELESNTAVIVHPNDPEITWEVIEPEILETMEHGERYAETKSNVEKFSSTVEYLAKHTRAIHGLIDRIGQPVVLKAPVEAKALFPFFRSTFNCIYKKDVDVLDADGKPTGAKKEQEVTEALANYIVMKLMDKETFAHPLAMSPSTPSSTSV